MRERTEPDPAEAENRQRVQNPQEKKRDIVNAISSDANSRSSPRPMEQAIYLSVQKKRGKKKRAMPSIMVWDSRRL
jgi:hypothetical protein